MQKLRGFSYLKRIMTNFREKNECWKAPRYSDNISEQARYQIVEARWKVFPLELNS